MPIIAPVDAVEAARRPHGFTDPARLALSSHGDGLRATRVSPLVRVHRLGIEIALNVVIVTVDRPRSGRSVRLLASAAVICLALLLGPLSGAAGAHAVVVSSTPAAESRVQDPPSEVTVTFSEDVTTSLGGLEVVDTAGTRVDAGELRRPSPTELAVDLRPNLLEGTYIASFRVVGVDDHTITGSWVFAVGDAPLDTRSDVQPDGDPTWEWLAALSRALMYLGTLVAAGGIIFLAFIVDGAAGRSQLTRLLDVSAAVGAVGLLAWTATQAVLASGRGVAAVADPDVLEIVLRDTMGWPFAATLVGLVTIVAAARTSSVVARQTLGFYGAAAIVGGFALWGHPRLWEPRAVAIGSDLAHAASAAIWLGGLASLAVVLRCRGQILRSTRTPIRETATIDPLAAVGTVDVEADTAHNGLVTATGETVARFSTVAAAALAILWIAGAVLAWSALDEPGDLVSTSYGRFVLSKAMVVVAAAGIAAWNRRALVPAIARDAIDAEERNPNSTDLVLGRWERLRRGVRAEAALLTLAVVLAGFLVATPPPSATTEDASLGEPFEAVSSIGEAGASIEVIVTPAATGENTIHISYFDSIGLPTDLVQSVVLELNAPVVGTEPIVRDARRVGPGHYTWTGNSLTIGGTWTIAVTSRVTQFEQEVTTMRVPIAA